MSIMSPQKKNIYSFSTKSRPNWQARSLHCVLWSVYGHFIFQLICTFYTLLKNWSQVLCLCINIIACVLISSFQCASLMDPKLWSIKYLMITPCLVFVSFIIKLPAGSNMSTIMKFLSKQSPRYSNLVRKISSRVTRQKRITFACLFPKTDIQICNADFLSNESFLHYVCLFPGKSSGVMEFPK